jgi:hypothetical protein
MLDMNVGSVYIFQLMVFKHFDASPVPVLLEKNVLSSVVHFAANALGVALDVDRPTLLRGKKKLFFTHDRQRRPKKLSL